MFAMVKLKKRVELDIDLSSMGTLVSHNWISDPIAFCSWSTREAHGTKFSRMDQVKFVEDSL